LLILGVDHLVSLEGRKMLVVFEQMWREYGFTLVSGTSNPHPQNSTNGGIKAEPSLTAAKQQE
jgi:hypothetical protein